MATMVQSERRADEGYSPEMDGRTHEKTYEGFIVFTAIGAVVVACWVLALAMGGVKGAWFAGILGVIASMIAGTVGALFPNLSWRPAAVVFALMAVVFILS